MDHPRDCDDAERRLRALSPRELEVLALLTTGATTQLIADELLIKPATVKSHLRSVYRKLCVANRVQAARCYLLGRDVSASSAAAASTSSTSVARSSPVVPGCRMHARRVSRLS